MEKRDVLTCGPRARAAAASAAPRRLSGMSRSGEGRETCGAGSAQRARNAGQARERASERTPRSADQAERSDTPAARTQDAPVRNLSARTEASNPRHLATASAGIAPRRIHVLTLVDHLSTTGGAERLAIDIATRIDPARFRSSLCASRYPRWGTASADELAASARLHEAGVEFIPIERRRLSDAVRFRRLARYLRHEHVDVVHAHMFGSNLWGTVLGRIAGVPVIIAHEHTWSFEGEPLRRALDREVIARFSSVFLSVSHADRRRMIEVERIAPEHVRFLANGIVGRAPTPGRDMRAELGLGGAPLIGAVGALRLQKAYDVLLRAAVRLRESHPDVRVLVAGEGTDRPRLEGLIAELGLGDTVMLLGLRLDVPDLLAALDVAVCSSSFEGSPLSVMEYMEAGLPIVATCVGGVPDLIDDGVHGLLVEPGEPEQLARAVEQLLGDRARAARLGASAQERRRREFDLDVMVANVEALYAEQYSAARPSRRRVRSRA